MSQQRETYPLNKKHRAQHSEKEHLDYYFPNLHLPYPFVKLKFEVAIGSTVLETSWNKPAPVQGIKPLGQSPLTIFLQIKNLHFCLYD